jgi:hypothetical protein
MPDAGTGAAQDPPADYLDWRDKQNRKAAKKANKRAAKVAERNEMEPR